MTEKMHPAINDLKKLLKEYKEFLRLLNERENAEVSADNKSGKYKYEIGRNQVYFSTDGFLEWLATREENNEEHK